MNKVMEDLKTKEEILSEYFLVETEKTDEIKGWKVVGTIEGCAGQSVSPLLELKTDGDGWLCDFKIKLLHCGLVLCSPEYMIDEDELEIWQERKIRKAREEFPEARCFYFEDRRGWNDMICNMLDW